MSILEYKTHISADGAVAPIPDWPGGETDAVIVVRQPKPTVDPTRIMPNGKTAVEDFLQFCTGIVGEITDEELDRLKYERLMEKYR